MSDSQKTRRSLDRTPFWDGIVDYAFPQQSSLQTPDMPLAHYLSSADAEQIITETGTQNTLIQDAAAHLNPECIATTVQYLRHKSGLLNRVALQIAQHLAKTYQQKRLELVQHDSHIAQFTPNFDTDVFLNNIHDFTQTLFENNNLWERGATEIWSNLIFWTIEELKTEKGEAVLNTLDRTELNQMLYHQLFDREAVVMQYRITFLEEFFAQRITRHIIQDLPDYPLANLEALLGIANSRKPIPTTEVSLSKLDTIAPIPTGLPIVSSISAQLQPDRWKPDSSGIAHFRYRSKNNSNNYLEHYITNPGDIEALPWEAAEQIINKFGFNTVKLQFILAAHAMRQAKPWEGTFTLKATDIITELGWDRNHSSTLPEKRNDVASTAYALSCLLVKAVWVEGQGKHIVDATTPVGRMWEVLIDPHGQLDWTTGRIEKPDEVYITVRPGLWTAYFLNQAGNKAKEALYQFGYLALNILKLDPYHDELTLRLAIHLTLDVRIRARDRNPYEYRVRTLLEAILPETAIQEARQNSEKARSLFNRWHHALKLLAGLGWQSDHPDFYSPPSPEWLEPDAKVKKPRGWVDQWLEQKLVIRPPDPIPERMASLTSAKKQRQKSLKPSASLTGADIKQARKQRGWTQTKLAGTLGIHQSLIAKIESGDRPISTELEPALRRVLDIDTEH